MRALLPEHLWKVMRYLDRLNRRRVQGPVTSAAVARGIGWPNPQTPNVWAKRLIGLGAVQRDPVRGLELTKFGTYLLRELERYECKQRS